MVNSPSSLTFTALVAGALSMGSVASYNLQARQTQGVGTPLYLNAPYCNYYQCDIIWYPGDNVTASWLDAPSGNVILDMMTDAGATFKYNVATVPGVTQDCDSTGGSTCGAFSWIVPSEWLNGTTYGNYSLRASSQNDPSIQSYTDIILVKPPNGTSTTSVPFKALDPTASSSSNSSSSNSVSATSTPTSTGGSSGQTTSNTSSGAGSSSKSGTNSAPSFVNPNTQAIFAFGIASIFAGLAFVL